MPISRSLELKDRELTHSCSITLNHDVMRLSLLEAFRLAAWGKNTFIKESTRKSRSDRTGRTIKYLDFGEHLLAVQSFCPVVDDKLVVFQEYDIAMDKFKEGGVAYKKGACIIGQPGIGKTCFIAYAVVELLRDEKPVAIQVAWDRFHEEYLLFTSNTVAIHDGRDIEPLRAHPQIWTFSDANHAALEPTLAFLSFRSNLRIFQTTSPAEQRWKEWTKQSNVDLYTMDVPSLEEIVDLAIILGKDVQGMKDFAEKWGPVPRILLRLLDLPSRQEVLEDEVADAVTKATGNPSVFFDAIIAHKSSSVRGSSTVFFIGPTSKTKRATTSVYVPTRWLADQLVQGLFLHDEKQRADFFRVMSPHSQSLSTSGWMFESVVHRFLAHEEKITIHWSNGDIETLSHKPFHTYGVDSNLQGYNPPYYWLPTSSNFPGINAAIITTNHVFGIQATLRFTHGPPTNGLKKLRLKFAQDSPMRDWSQYKVLLVGCRDEQAESLSNQHAGNVQVEGVTIPVGWLTVPMGTYGFQLFGPIPDGTEEDAVDEEEAVEE